MTIDLQAPRVMVFNGPEDFFPLNTITRGGQVLEFELPFENQAKELFDNTLKFNKTILRTRNQLIIH